LLACLQSPAIARAGTLSDGCRAKDETAIGQVAQQWKDGYNAGNASQVALVYDEHAYYLTQHFVTGIVEGRTSIKAYVQRGVDAGYHIDSIEVVSTGCSGDLATQLPSTKQTMAGTRC